MRERLRIATWNCFGVPPSIEDFFSGNPFWPERFESRALVEALSSHDVVCVQENLLEGVRARLEGIRAAAGFAELWCDPMGPDAADNTFVGSGLAIFSRFPVSVRFSRLPRGAGPDGFARKGFAVADVRLPSGRVVHVVNTHLQADDPHVPLEDCRAARAAQITELAAAISELAGRGPTVLCGDLNVIHGTDEYDEVHRALGGALQDLSARSGLATWDVERNDVTAHFLPPGSPDRALLDYIWASPGRFTAGEVRMILDEPLPDAVSCPLPPSLRPFASDHFGLAAVLELSD
ncbi:MAG: endonuclease/exonuclease/phosphatase family protein [Polyangiaceae bacterium]|nr:endonuclease/exonuclease/phosphatase family protein [Polyangiaceae bacterium]